MTWLQSFRGETRTNIENPAIPLSSSSLVDYLIGPRTEAGESVNERTAFSMPAVFRAISLVSGTVASLPLHVYRDKGFVREQVSPTPGLIARPHPDLTQFEWTELSLVHALTWGNTYYRKLVDGSGIVRELWPIDPARVKVGRAKGGHKIYAIDTQDLSGAIEGKSDLESLLPLTDAEVLHVPGMGYDGISGMSPIAAARQGIGLSLAADKFAARLFGSGNLMSGILSTDQKLTESQADTLKARWKAQHSGADAQHDIGVLGAGVKFQQISYPPEDVQFIESRKFQVAEIARIYGVPPHMLMDTDRSTSWGTGIEQQGIGFVVYTLRPWLSRFEQRLSLLLPNPQYAKFSVEGLLRGDTAARYNSYAVGKQNGWLSTNEIRRYEDLPPVDGGDEYLQPSNTIPIGPPTAEPAVEGDPSNV